MADLKEQRIFVKLCFRLGKTASETYEILKTAFGDIAMGRTQTFEWFSRFKRGETSIEDSLRSGRPPTGRTDENVENVRKIVSENRRNTITEIAGRLGLSYGTCQRILTEDLNMRRISAKFVPRLHTEEQKQRRVFVCQELLDEVIPNASNTKACRYEKGTWSECSSQNQMTLSESLKADSEPSCEQSRQITKKCKNKGAKSSKGGRRNKE